MAISMLKIRRPLGRLIFNMGIAIPGKTVFLIETAHRPSESCLVFISDTDISYYIQTSKINRTKSQNLNVCRLVLQLFLPVEDQDIVGAAPKGDVPTT